MGGYRRMPGLTCLYELCYTQFLGNCCSCQIICQTKQKMELQFELLNWYGSGSMLILLSTAVYCSLWLFIESSKCDDYETICILLYLLQKPRQFSCTRQSLEKRKMKTCRVSCCLVYATFRNAFSILQYGNAALMVNRISCDSNANKSLMQQLTSDTIIEVVLYFYFIFLWFYICGIPVKGAIGLPCGIQVSIEIPFPFQAIPKQAIESAGTQVLEQILRIMLPRFVSQVC